MCQSTQLACKACQCYGIWGHANSWWVPWNWLGSYLVINTTTSCNTCICILRIFKSFDAAEACSRLCHFCHSVAIFKYHTWNNHSTIVSLQMMFQENYSWLADLENQNIVLAIDFSIRHNFHQCECYTYKYHNHFNTQRPHLFYL